MYICCTNTIKIISELFNKTNLVEFKQNQCSTAMSEVEKISAMKQQTKLLGIHIAQK